MRALLLDGYDRSPTIREIVDQIAASGWLVFVQKAPCPEKAMIACLRHLVGRFDGAQYLRVHVDNLHRHQDNVIGSIAHELQHAREVVTASDITDGASIRDLFKRIGYLSARRDRVTTYETRVAMRVQEAVRKELSRRPSAPRRASRGPSS